MTRARERACTWTPAALVWPWDPDHPGYGFPGHTASLRGVSSYPSTRIWPRQSPPIFKGNHSSVPLYPARPQPTSYSPKLGPYERPVSSLPKQSRHLLSCAHSPPTQPTNLTLTRLDRSPSHSPLDHTIAHRLVLSTCCSVPPTRPASASDCMFPCLYSQPDT